MSVKERKERQKLEMKDAILSASLRLFSDEGYENVTMRKIANKIEYSVGTIYLYFKDKSEMLYELHNKGFDEFYRKQLSIQHIKDPIERLQAHGEAYMNFAMENPEYYDLMFISRSSSRQIKKYKHWNEGERTYELLKLNIKQAMETGIFKDVDLEVAAFSLWSFVHGMSSLYVRERLSMMPTEFIRPMIMNSLQFLRRAN
jgi:AcrR family transcriptional regulator